MTFPEKCNQYLVQIQVADCSETTYRTGYAFAKDWVLTVAHDLPKKEDIKSVRIEWSLADDKSVVENAELFEFEDDRNTEMDWALFRLEDNSPGIFSDEPIRRLKTVHSGELYVRGYPASRSGHIRPAFAGEISKLTCDRAKQHQIKITPSYNEAEYFAGMSGSPIVDPNGVITGLLTAIIEDSGGRTGWMIPFDTIIQRDKFQAIFGEINQNKERLELIACLLEETIGTNAPSRLKSEFISKLNCASDDYDSMSSVLYSEGKGVRATFSLIEKLFSINQSEKLGSKEMLVELTSSLVPLMVDFEETNRFIEYLNNNEIKVFEHQSRSYIFAEATIAGATNRATEFVERPEGNKSAPESLMGVHDIQYDENGGLLDQAADPDTFERGLVRKLGTDERIKDVVAQIDDQKLDNDQRKKAEDYLLETVKDYLDDLRNEHKQIKYVVLGGNYSAELPAKLRGRIPQIAFIRLSQGLDLTLNDYAPIRNIYMKYILK